MRTISARDLTELSAQAASRPRRRANLNLHPTLDDPIQRFFNAVEPGTYVRPHRHTEPGRWEVFVALRGRAAVLTFDPSGRVTERVEIAPEGPDVAVEVEPGAWHTVLCRAPATVLFELKPGPYVPLEDKSFALWAPPEGGTVAMEFVRWAQGAVPGDGPPPPADD
jgi:cupin fold WbuC family metalloprotein